MKNNYVMIFFCISILYPIMGSAQTPITTEGINIQKGKLKFESSLAYSNWDQQTLVTSAPVPIQTGPTSFVNLPIVIGELKGNSDALVGTLGLRYGLSEKTDVYGRLSYLHIANRSTDINNSSYSLNRFSDSWIGINHQFRNDDSGPAILGFTEIALRERGTENSSSFKSALAGFTTYKTFDPTLLSLTVAYQGNQSRRDGQNRLNPGNVLLFSPSISLAMNEKIMVMMGFQWSHRTSDRINGLSNGTVQTSTDLLLGAGVGVTKSDLININFKANVSGRNGADLRISWLHSF